MMADDLNAPNGRDERLSAEDDIQAELDFLQQALKEAEASLTDPAMELDWLRQEGAPTPERPRYRPMGPAMTRVAAVGLATFPAVLTPLPSFANVPLPPNLALAMASRPAAPPALAAAGANLFPFSRPMRDVRAQVGVAPAQPTQIAGLPLNPRLKTMFSQQRKVAVTTKRVAAATFYNVAQGDSLYSIAADILGSGGRWREIYNANQSKVGPAYLLRPGQKLVIPTQRKVREVHVAQAPAQAVAQMAAHPAVGPYKVTPGDNLYTIAAKRLGDPNRWKEIVMMNKAVLGGKTVIYPNQWLLLPTVT